MSRLLKHEIYKVLKGKTLYIFLICMTILMISITYFDKLNNTHIPNNYDEEINYLEDQLSNEDSNVELILTELFILNGKVGNDSYWVKDYLEIYYNEIYEYYLYAINENLLNEINYNIENNLYNVYLDKKIELLLNTINYTKVSTTKKEYLEYELYLLNYWKNNITNIEDYVMDAIENSLNMKYEILFDNNTYLENELTLNNYAIFNETDIFNTDNAKANLELFYDYYIQYILIFILVISSTILGTEFKSGTIKNTLTSPFKREEILFTKILTIIIISLLTTILLIFINTIIAGSLYSFRDLAIPVVKINESTLLLEKDYIIIYLFKLLIAFTPVIIILALISILITIFVPNTALSLCITLIIFMVSQIINQQIIINEIESLKFLLTLNWDFSTYLYGSKNQLSIITLKYSLCIYITHLILLYSVIIRTFKKKYILTQ
ncbi:MAG: ABC transporter permease subunit [bacterium]